MYEFLLIAVVILYVAISYRSGNPKTRRRWLPFQSRRINVRELGKLL
jgi:thiosulfate reductase cytochrome b subunit